MRFCNLESKFLTAVATGIVLSVSTPCFASMAGGYTPPSMQDMLSANFDTGFAVGTSSVSPDNLGELPQKIAALGGSEGYIPAGKSTLTWTTTAGDSWFGTASSDAKIAGGAIVGAKTDGSFASGSAEAYVSLEFENNNDSRSVAGTIAYIPANGVRLDGFISGNGSLAMNYTASYQATDGSFSVELNYHVENNNLTGNYVVQRADGTSSQRDFSYVMGEPLFIADIDMVYHEIVGS